MKIVIAISSFFIVACVTKNESKPVNKSPYLDFNKKELNKNANTVYVDNDQFYTY